MAMTRDGVARIFKLLGLPMPDNTRLDRIANDGRSATQIRDDLLAWGKKQGGSTYQKMVDAYAANGGKDPKLVSQAKSGGAKTDSDPKTKPGVLAGGKTIRVGNRYYQIYEFPPKSGNFISYQFNNLAQTEAALGKGFDVETRTESWYNNNVSAKAAAEEVIGLSGTWTKMTGDLMRDAALKAGVKDPTLVGRMAADPEMQQIMVQALAGEWTPQQILAAQRKTKFWTQTLYPGIENLYAGSQNPEQDYRQYVASAQGALDALGYKKDRNGTYNSHIKKMLDNKIDIDIFLSMVPTFVRATQNKDFAKILNQWSVRDLGKKIDFKDWFGLMKGESQPELEAVAERATLAWTAQNQGAQVSEAQVRRLAAKTQMSAAEAAQAFSEFTAGVLATGEAGLARYGLTRDDVLSASAGIKTQKGKSVEEIKLMVAKVARENALFDDEKINFYVGFTPGGKPIRPGLQSLAPEGG